MTDYLRKFDEFPSFDNNIYVYCRVSTDLQTTDTQLLEIYNFCLKERIYPPSKNVFSDDGISGYKVSWKKRKIYEIAQKLKKGDMVIVPEISRLSRKMDELNEIVKFFNDNGVTLIGIKNNLRLDGSLSSKILCQVLTMVSEIERDQISKRVKDGMERARLEGKLTGRNRGTKKNKLDNHIEEIKKYIEEKKTYKQMSILLKTDIAQVYKYIKKNNL